MEISKLELNQALYIWEQLIRDTDLNYNKNVDIVDLVNTNTTYLWDLLQKITD